MSVSLYGSGQTVLQVVQGTLSTQATTTSSSFVSTGLTATITPQSTTSKILVICSYGAGDSTTTGGSYHTINRGATNLGAGNFGMGLWYGNTNNPWNFWVSMTYLDSPSTTSATTYTAQFRANGSQTIYAMSANSMGTITLIEISGS